MSKARMNRIPPSTYILYSFRNIGEPQLEPIASYDRYRFIKHCTDVNELKLPYFNPFEFDGEWLTINHHYHLLFVHDYEGYVNGYFFLPGNTPHSTGERRTTPEDRDLLEWNHKYTMGWQLLLLKRSLNTSSSLELIQYIFFWGLYLERLERYADDMPTEYVRLREGPNGAATIPPECQLNAREIHKIKKIFKEWENISIKKSKKYLNDKRIVKERLFKDKYKHWNDLGMTIDEEYDVDKTTRERFHVEVFKKWRDLSNEYTVRNGRMDPGLRNSIQQAVQIHGAIQAFLLQTRSDIDVTSDLVSMLAGCHTFPPLIDYIASKGRNEIVARILAERPDFREKISPSNLERLQQQIGRATARKRPPSPAWKVEALQLLWNHAKATKKDEFYYDERKDEYRLVTTAETGAGQEEGNTRTGDENEARPIQTYLGREINVNFHHLIDRNGQLRPSKEGVFDKYNELYGPNRAQTVLKDMLITPPSSTS